MYKTFLVLKISIIFLLYNSANSQVKYEFTDFQYPEESVSWGSKGKSTYFIPVDENQTLKKGSELHLDFKTSQVLNPQRSYVTVAINDVPVATKSPNLKSRILNFVIPLSQNNINSGFIKVDIYNDLVIDNDVCETYGEGAFWSRRLSSSHVILNTEKRIKKGGNTISKFIDETQQIYIPENPSLNTIKYTAYIKFYFNRAFGKNLKINSIPDRLDSVSSGSILLGKYKEFDSILSSEFMLDSVDKGEGLVKLHSLKFKDSLKSTSFQNRTFLLVTGVDDKGVEKASQSLLDENIIKSAFTTSYLVNQGLDLNAIDNEAIKKISLRNLGVSEGIIEGMGKMQKTITFPSAIFPSGVSQLKLNLKFIYRPLKKTEKVYVNIYVDNILKSSHSLNDSGVFENVLNFYDLDLKQENNIRIEYYYLPEGGDCMIKPAPFYAQIDLDASDIEAVSFKKNKKLNFGNFTQNLFKNKAIIYWDLPYDIEQISSLSKLVEAHNPELAINREYIFPAILTLDSLESNINTNSGIIITSQAGSLKKFGELFPSLDIKNSQYDFKKENYSNYFKLNFNEDLGINQLFERKGKDFMFIYNPEGNPAILKQLIGRIQNSNLTNKGNLILASKENSYNFSLKNQEILSENEVEANFDSFWENYRIVIIFGLLILLIVLLIYIFQKSQESKNSIVENK